MGLPLPVGRIGGAGKRAAADRRNERVRKRLLQTTEVALKHHRIGHQVVSEGDGLRPLEVGVSGENDRLVRFGELGDRFEQRDRQRLDAADLAAEIQPEVKRRLVVAGAGCVKLFAHGAQPVGERLLDEHMDILGAGINAERAGLQLGEDTAQRVLKLLGFVMRDNAAVRKHGGVRHGAGNVLPEHAAVESDGRVESVRDLRRFFLGPSGPHFFHVPYPQPFRSPCPSSACTRVGSPQILMKPADAA